MKKLQGYLQGVWAELKKITFPTKKDTVGLTLLILTICIILAIYTGILDLGFGRVVQSIIAR
ncbi:MAG: preprotein translocase subunit SecE [Pseudomonadales bacterium]|jgi:preprotein translocase subunit SecE|nr:preprotein translocase subunit SecE [Pseudomonadales bacterium]